MPILNAASRCQHAPNNQDNKGADDCPDKTSTFTRTVPSESLPKICCYYGTDDAQNSRQDKSRRLVRARMNKFRDDPRKKSDHDCPNYTHGLAFRLTGGNALAADWLRFG